MKLENEGSKILIVDDDHDNLNLLLEFLELAGYHPFAATDGENAIEQIKYIGPDLILLDVMMPGIDGFETCRILKTMPEIMTIPVIFMTALSETVNKVKGFEVGGVDYVTKPFQNEEILARINAHLTIRKLQKELREKNAELKELNINKDKFFSILAHDLKSPMLSFLSFMRLQDNVENMKQEQLVTYTKEFQECSKTLYSILENLITWSNIQRGLIEYTPGRLDIQTIVMINILHFKTYAEQKKIELKNLVSGEIFI